MKLKIIEEKNGIFFSNLKKQKVWETINSLQKIINFNRDDVFYLKGQDIKSIAYNGITYDNVDIIYNNIISLPSEKVGTILLDKIKAFDAENIKEILVNFTEFRKKVFFTRTISESESAYTTIGIRDSIDSIDTDELDWNYDYTGDTSSPEVSDESYEVNINLPLLQTEGCITPRATMR